MPKLKLNIFNNPNTKEKPADTVLNLILMAVHSKYKEGLSGDYRRTFGRIQSKLDEAVTKDVNSVELEISELEFIKRAFTDGKVLAVWSKLTIALEDAVEDAIKSAKKQ